ncbi:DUF4236 domain-containing protein [Paenibacillus sp. V4I5]|uniref:DUF4236 domain-containing protein n=1 Tax=Paenibacillus sp. V4I5 TaxID=3042306 RepID=UPI0027D8A203|nr:DUF4236 domain-containing protein [Paenibacillus sp. V4I5]
MLINSFTGRCIHGIWLAQEFQNRSRLRLNASQGGLGISFGVKGLRHSIHSSGRRTTTASIPGTGLYYQSSHGGAARSYRSPAYQRKAG